MCEFDTVFPILYDPKGLGGKPSIGEPVRTQKVRDTINSLNNKERGVVAELIIKHGTVVIDVLPEIVRIVRYDPTRRI